MRYHGGKSRQGYIIANIINNILEENTSLSYLEPFCGMCGVLRYIVTDNIIVAGDINDSVIQMWTALQDGWQPEISNVNEEYYNDMKANGESSAEKGFFGVALTFGALYFQVFMSKLVDLLPYSKKSVIQISKDIPDVIFIHGDYTTFSTTDNCVIFCDPPYEKYNRYYDENNNKLKFDHDLFWEWCCRMCMNNNIVVVIENPDFFSRETLEGVQLEKVTISNRISRFGKTKTKIEEVVGIFKNFKLSV